jgi:hypothetical protein
MSAHLEAARFFLHGFVPACAYQDSYPFPVLRNDERPLCITYLRKDVRSGSSRLRAETRSLWFDNRDHFHALARQNRFQILYRNGLSNANHGAISFSCFDDKRPDRFTINVRRSDLAVSYGLELPCFIVVGSY